MQLFQVFYALLRFRRCLSLKVGGFSQELLGRDLRGVGVSERGMARRGRGGGGRTRMAAGARFLTLPEPSRDMVPGYAFAVFARVAGRRSMKRDETREVSTAVRSRGLEVRSEARLRALAEIQQSLYKSLACILLWERVVVGQPARRRLVALAFHAVQPLTNAGVFLLNKTAQMRAYT